MSITPPTKPGVYLFLGAWDASRVDLGDVQHKPEVVVARDHPQGFMYFGTTGIHGAGNCHPVGSWFDITETEAGMRVAAEDAVRDAVAKRWLEAFRLSHHSSPDSWLRWNRDADDDMRARVAALVGEE